MSFGSSMRFEVKDGKKGGIFWEREKPKQKPRKFGYKTKELRHTIRRVEPEYIEEPKEKVKSDKDFIRKNRDQYKKRNEDDDKENHMSHSRASGRPSSSIKPGTVTLTQDQLNALLATVGQLKPGEANNVRISIDAENNKLQLESPRDNMESAPHSERSDTKDKKEEASIFDMLKDKKAGNRDSSGEEKTSGTKEVRFDTARNEERQKTPEPTPAPPPLVPWQHMTVAERKRLQWAREKAAEEELQKQRNYDPWGRPGAGAPPQKSEPEPQPARPPQPAQSAKPDPPSQSDSQFRTAQLEEEQLRKAIDAIEAKYGDLLKSPEPEKQSSKSPAGIPGLDDSYTDGPSKGKSSSKTSKQLADRGNTRPRRTDKQDDRKDRGDRTRDSRRRANDSEYTRRGEKGVEEKRQKRTAEEERKSERRSEEEHGRDRQEGGGGSRASGLDTAVTGPAAMQTSLFIGQPEPDNSRFVSRKEEEKKRWLEELDRQREENRLQKQKEKEKQREGIDDTWADRFVTSSSRPPPPSYPQQQPQPSPYSYSTTDTADRTTSHHQGRETDTNAMPPAAMRSAMSIGNVAPNLDRIETKKAEEKRLWLEELNKQREEQRDARMRLKDKQRADEETWASRFTQEPRSVAAEPSASRGPVPSHAAATTYRDNTDRISSAPQPVVNEPLDDDSKTYLRGQNVHMDPVTKRELEEKRLKHLEYQTAIKAQIEEKERQKREERERKWRDEIEGEKKLKAERDALQRQLESETSKTRQREEARQRQVEQLKSVIDAEHEKAQEERMLKRLATLQQAGHDVSGLKAHYEAVSPRRQQVVVDSASVPGLLPSPRDAYHSHVSPRPVPATYRATDGPGSVHNSQELYSHAAPTHEPYTEHRVLTPSRFRHPSQPRNIPNSPLREFATQTDGQLGLIGGLRKEISDVEIEFRGGPPKDNTKKGSKNTRTKSAESRRPAENVKGKPPPPKQTRQKQQQQKGGKAATWNYQNPKQKTAVKQSEKDLFYEQKRLECEERRAKRERQLQYLVEINKQVIPTEKQARSNHPSSQHPLNTDSGDAEQAQRDGPSHGRVVNGHVSHRSPSPPINRTGRYRPNNRNRSPPVPAVKRRTGHDAGKHYETDFDTETHNYYRPGPAFSPSMDEQGNIVVPTKDTDFIPFMRTNDVLDPSKAEEPIHLSRENTRIKQARQHYHENLRPADYGNQVAVYQDSQRQIVSRHKDPILNPGLVKDYPTARQDQILQQLSSLKQSLIQRRREIETCMSPSDLEK